MNPAPRAVLSEENGNDPPGKRLVGSAAWSADFVTPSTAKPGDLEVLGDIEVPERGMSVTLTLRRDTDPNASISHTIEIMFKLPPDFQPGSISNVLGIWMKQAEQTQGTPLAGIAVKGTTGHFLIGLSSAPTDKELNIQLLKDRRWIDIPIVYTNNQRATLTIEKGTSGEQVFQQVFAGWQQ